MNVSRRVLLAGFLGILIGGPAFADVGYDNDAEERYRQIMNDKWGDAFEATDHYAAIAYSPSTGKYGYSHNFENLDNAKRRAIEECKAGDAKVIVWARNAYCALAKGSDGSYGAAFGMTIAQAKSRALAECRKHTQDCEVVLCVSTGR